jgi:hypothetical protein
LLAIEIPFANSGSIAIQATAGIALYLIVYFNFKKLFGNFMSPGFNFSIPEGMTFRQIADSFAQTANSVVEFIGFTEDELTAQLRQGQIHSETIEEAFLSLRHLSEHTNIYDGRLMSR